MKVEKLDGVCVVSISAEMHAAIIELAGPRDWHATRESWLAGAARKAGISYRTAKSIFYRQHEDHRGAVIEKVRAAVARENEATRDVKTEIRELRERLLRLQARMEKGASLDS